MSIPKSIALAVLATAINLPANCQVIRYYSGSVSDTVPRVIERRVLSAPIVPQAQSVETRMLTAEPLVTLREERRSDYSKRLADILEQITFAYSKNWLSRAQFDDLKSWQANVAMEELVLRQKGGGIVDRSDVEQMERHLNGLAYTANKEIEEGSKVASTGGGAM